MPADYRIGRLNGRYVVSWWADGKRKRYRLDALTAKDAEREAIDIIRREVVAPPGSTIADLWEAYRAEKEGRRVSVAMMHEWKALGPHFGHLRPDQITTAVCRAYTASRKKTPVRGKTTGAHDGTIWTELGHLRSVLNWALGDKAPKIERPAKPAPKERYLTHAEIAKLLDAPAPLHIKTAIYLMLCTAARVGAALELTWDRVSFDREQVDLRTGIGGLKGRAVVPMNADLRAVLQSARAATVTDYVIEWAGQPVANIKTGFNAVVAAAGLANVSPHVLRHTAAVHMVEGGVPIPEVAQYLGHTNPDITFRVYGRFSPTHLRKAADLLNFSRLRSVAS
ncbi:tyrosine-type recombinase/integrase [Methylobacterium sp. E-045]|uniref:tyrosine-type recombinase/integrase n=1 Tax=Methylobacterium sp. E-045 TaxID=2836575 RepID=UPI001FBAA80C|nr:site-specific integrase [Methylobacterium sp. E-045]MCJ2128327.1 site-specific integrase [Methylobacterium sp. E-045]